MHNYFLPLHSSGFWLHAVFLVTINVVSYRLCVVVVTNFSMELTIFTLRVENWNSMFLWIVDNHPYGYVGSESERPQPEFSSVEELNSSMVLLISILVFKANEKTNGCQTWLYINISNKCSIASETFSGHTCSPFDPGNL